MLYGNFNFTCRFETPAQLPEYKGSTFRGIFGRALKQVVCALKHQTCPDCLLRSDCLYPQVFESQLSAGDGDVPQRNTTAPYVIQPPTTTRRHYAEGDAFNFNLLLFGPVNSRLPYFIYALREMGRLGVGKKIDGRRGTYRLESVSVGEQILYSDTDRKLHVPADIPDLALTPPPTGPTQDPRTVALSFETPLRVKYNNRLAPDMPFHVLVRAMLRRAADLLARFDGAEPNLDYRGLVQQAKSVATLHNRLQWVDWRRYSMRQDQAMLMGGLSGTVTYHGNLSPYLGLLDFCSRVHLGKQTSFGLGRYSVEVVS